MSARSNIYRWTIILLLPVITCNVVFAGKTLYVDDDAAGANDGSSWADAYKYLQDALADAESSDKPVEIRVAQGIYRPDRNTAEPNGTGDRTATFQLINGVTLKGGYAGHGETHPNARDVERYETVLSGDLKGDDIDVNDPSNLLHEPTRAENSYGIVRSRPAIDTTAVLDGFIVRDGNFNYALSGGRTGPSPGSGMKNYGSPVVIKCTFAHNSTIGGGVVYNLYERHPRFVSCVFICNDSLGMFNDRMSNPTLLDCTFVRNMRGAIENYESRPIVEGCKFTENSGVHGGAIYSYRSNPIFEDCLFIRNKASTSAALGRGGNGGAMFYTGGAPLLTNCSFILNEAEQEGGAIYSIASNVTLNNCTFMANSAAQGCAIVFDAAPYPSRIVNSILWDSGDEIRNNDGSSITISFSDVQGGQAEVYDPRNGLVWGEGNIDTDPLFADPDSGDYHLKSQAGRFDPSSQSWIQDDVTSPCIDAGDPNSPIGDEPFPNGGVINMGAYGGTSEASKSYFGGPVCETIITGDINGDCKVDLSDFVLMANHWLEEG